MSGLSRHQARPPHGLVGVLSPTGKSLRPEVARHHDERSEPNADHVCGLLRFRPPRASSFGEWAIKVKPILPDSEEHPLASSRTVPKVVSRWIRANETEPLDLRQRGVTQ